MRPHSRPPADPLGPARGMVLGLACGLALWGAVALVAVHLHDAAHWGALPDLHLGGR